MSDKRIRIGYTSVAYFTEVFTRDFYRIVPEGVTLALLTMQQTSFEPQHIRALNAASLQAGKDMARAGVDLVILGGGPVNMANGLQHVDAMMEELSKEVGVPVSSSATARMRAYKVLGSKRVVTVQPFDDSKNAIYEDYIPGFGLEHVGCIAGQSNLIDLNGLPESAALDWGRKALREYPDADTLHFPCPHWPVISVIDELEEEFGVNVVSSLQAIAWEGLRRCGVDQEIEGFGRLFREF